MSTTPVPAPALSPLLDRPKKKYVPAVGPRLRKLLLVVLGLTALLTANSCYLLAISTLEWVTHQPYQNWFSLGMVLAHLILGLLLIVPLVVFGTVHLLTSRKRKNRRAIRIGYALFAVSLGVLITGLLLVRVSGLFDLKNPTARSAVYWLHLACPLAAGWLYWLHRLAGPRIRWRVGLRFAGVIGAAVVVMMILHSQDPRRWNVTGPQEGEQYFFPSLARTATGKYIPAQTLMMDNYCQKCHQDIYQDWFHSAHHLSSFNNQAYLASVRETREVSLKRDRSVHASRWCAGCHDPVPFFSGAFDDPKFDDVHDPRSQAGITCTTCHAITHINSTRGNADYTIEEPQHYPFAYSDNAVLQYINNLLVKAKPEFHKQTFLKPLQKTAEFCATCHKVHIPGALNHYKEFLRGQNHYDSYLLSGVSGHGARSFYYPDQAKSNCAACHMPPQTSNDFGARFFPGTDHADMLSVHNHLFPAANTGIAALQKDAATIKAEQEFLKGAMRVDLFGLKEAGTIDGKLSAPLGSKLPTLEPGRNYLLETVVRTLKLGHAFTEGTADSNEIWLEITATAGGRVIGHIGAIDNQGAVDPWSYFFNIFMLDRDGNHISRRNPQDIFVPLYNHQIPPGAARVVHSSFRVPENLKEPLMIEAKLQYRKFTQEYLNFVTRSAHPGDNPIPGYVPGQPYKNSLPVTTLAVDRITFPVNDGDKAAQGGQAHLAHKASQNEPVPASSWVRQEIPLWQRWNDYGIALLLEGQGKAQGELRQAGEAFGEVEKLGRFDGPLNLARVYYVEGRLDEAVDALGRASAAHEPAVPRWTLAWLSGQVNRQQGHLAEAEKDFRSVVEDITPAMRDRGFNFGLDYEVLNELGATLFDEAKQIRSPQRAAERDAFLRSAAETFERTLSIDSENVSAHYNLALIYGLLGDEAQAAEHQKLHARYKPDDNARDRAVSAARQKYPAANAAAENVVIYSLQRSGAPGVPETAKTDKPADHSDKDSK
jgi:tetratricopeptide (TPR) repeat protein